MVISSPLVANVLRIINLPMTLENLLIAANGFPLVPIGNDIWDALNFHTVFQVFKVLKNLLVSYSYIFVTDFNVFTQNPTSTPSITTRIR